MIQILILNHYFKNSDAKMIANFLYETYICSFTFNNNTQFDVTTFSTATGKYSDKMKNKIEIKIHKHIQKFNDSLKIQ